MAGGPGAGKRYAGALGASSPNLGLTELVINGETLTGPSIAIDSPMATVPSANQVNIDNGNVKTLTPVVLPTVTTGIDASTHTNFRLKLADNASIGAPTNPTNGEVIRFLFENNGGTFTPTWASIYKFGNSSSVGGPTAAQVDALAAAAADGDVWSVGFIYDEDNDIWMCAAIAGPYTP